MICDLKEINCVDFYSLFHSTIEQRLYQLTGKIRQVCLHLILEKFNGDVLHIQYGFLREDTLELIKKKVNNVFTHKDGNIPIDNYKVLKVSIEWFESEQSISIGFSFKEEVLYDKRKIES